MANSADIQPKSPSTDSTFLRGLRNGLNHFERAWKRHGSNSSSKSREDSGIHHRVFTWVPTDIGKESLHLEDMEVLENHGVPPQVLIKSIKDTIRREDAFFNLPYTLLFVITFAAWFISKDRTNDLRDIEDAVSVDLHENANFAFTTPNNMAHKDLLDVHSIADVFSWLRIGLTPLLFRTHQSWSELKEGADPWIERTLTAQQRRSYLQYNRVVGGVRLSQNRAAPGSCRRQVAETYDMQCSMWNMSAGTDLSIQPSHHDVIALSAKAAFDPELTRWLLLDDSREAIEVRLRQLELSAWIDNSTMHVAVQFFTYNAQLHSLTLTGAHFIFARTGRIWKKIVQQGAFLNSYDLKLEHWWVVAFDAVFALLVLRLFALECLEICSAFKSRGPESGFKWFREYLKVWNVIDWISIFGSFLLLIRWFWIVNLMKQLEQQLNAVSTEETDIFPSSVASLPAAQHFRIHDQTVLLQNHLDDFIELFDHVSGHQQAFQYLGGIFPIVLMLRLFKDFAFQPRLALVTRTLKHSLMDVAHFLVVFITMFGTFVAMAVALFGRHMHEFSTFPRAFNSCFVVLMGEFDHGDLFAETRVLGPIWFWMFQILLVLIMLNMLLAMIMENYSEVKGETFHTLTLPEQLVQVIRTRARIWTRQGAALPPKTIKQRLEEIYGHMSDLSNLSPEHKWDLSELIKVPDFMNMIDGLEEKQAKRLLKQSLQDWRNSHLKPLSMTDAVNTISHFQQQLLDESILIHANHSELVNQVSSIAHCLDIHGSEKAASSVCPRVAALSDGEGDRIHTLELGLKNLALKTDDRLGRLEDLSLRANERLDRMETILVSLDKRLTPSVCSI